MIAHRARAQSAEEETRGIGPVRDVNRIVVMFVDGDSSSADRPVHGRHRRALCCGSDAHRGRAFRDG